MVLIFSGGRYERMIDTAKIMTANNRKILIVSKMKKLTALAKIVSWAIPNTE
jgi:hypothetical protein